MTLNDLIDSIKSHSTVISVRSVHVDHDHETNTALFRLSILERIDSVATSRTMNVAVRNPATPDEEALPLSHAFAPSSPPKEDDLSGPLTSWVANNFPSLRLWHLADVNLDRREARLIGYDVSGSNAVRVEYVLWKPARQPIEYRLIS